MSNWIDPSMLSEYQQLAEKVLKEIDIDGLRVRYFDKENALYFTQDRRVVEVPIKLIKNNQWSDIRLLFRAILDSAPSLWNLSADKNDWSAYKSE